MSVSDLKVGDPLVPKKQEWGCKLLWRAAD